MAKTKAPSKKVRKTSVKKTKSASKARPVILKSGRRPVRKKTRAVASLKRRSEFAPVAVPAGDTILAFFDAPKPRRSRLIRRTDLTALWTLVAMGSVLFASFGIWAIKRTHLFSPYNPVTPPTLENTTTSPIEPALPVSALKEVEKSIDFGAVRKLELGARVAYWSGWLEKIIVGKKTFPARSLGTPPASEDSAPLIPERFNCTTFVETVGALAMSERPEDFYGRLLSIRYENAWPRYDHRNHFPESDWIGNNVKAGQLEDLTEGLAKSAGIVARFEEKNLNKARWVQKQNKTESSGRSIASLEGIDSKRWPESVPVKVPYIAVADVAKTLDQIPEGSVVNLVRKNIEEYSVLISHQGFLIRKNGQVYIRHSSTRGNIHTLPLMEYLQVQSKKPWHLLGININAYRKKNPSAETR